NNLILNGGFENGTCPSYLPIFTFCPNSISYPQCTIANWNCTGGGSQTYTYILDTSTSVYSVSIIIEGIKAPYFGNYYPKACSSLPNDTSCVHNTGCTVTGIPIGYPISGLTYGGTAGVSLDQTVTGLIVGTTYVSPLIG